MAALTVQATSLTGLTASYAAVAASDTFTNTTANTIAVIRMA